MSGCVPAVALSPAWWAQLCDGPITVALTVAGPACWLELARGQWRGQGGQDGGDVSCVHASVSMMPFFRLQKRAVKAENHVMKLKQEMSLLQVIRPQVFTCEFK